MSNNYSHLLELKNLTISYDTGNDIIKAVDNISFRLKQGESLGIIGESGCGKSSLALGIMGLIDKENIEGEVIYKNQNLLALKNKKLRKIRWAKIALVFQNSEDILNPVLKIGEQIEDCMRDHGDLSQIEITKKAHDLLKMVGLSMDWYRQYPHQLSGGMRQRTLLAMALACDPELLLIDEPTSSLDPAAKWEIVDLIKRLQKKLDFSMILISHDLKIIEEMTRRVLVMYKGTVMEIGITSEVIKDPSHCYSRGLLNSSPELFQYKDLWGIEGGMPLSNDHNGCVFYDRCSQHEEICKKIKPELKFVGVERMVACHKGGIETLLVANNLEKKFKLRGEKIIKALRGASLKIKGGEVLALVGKSGSGKSTLAHLLTGVLYPDSGSIKFMDKNIISSSPTKKMHGMQLIFQDPFSALSDRLNVLEVVTEPLEIIKWGNEGLRKKRAVKALTDLQLPGTDKFLQRKCRTLSGGQRQRAAIARALVMSPKLLIADEITSMLDPSVQANILRQLKGLQNKEGFSMLYITHNLYLARKIADKILVMRKGKIVEAGSARDIFDNPQTAYTKKIIRNF